MVQVNNCRQEVGCNRLVVFDGATDVWFYEHYYMIAITRTLPVDEKSHPTDGCRFALHHRERAGRASVV